MHQSRGLFLLLPPPLFEKPPNPLAAMHVLVDPLEIVPRRGGPPALRSRVPSILEALRAISQPRLEGAAEEVLSKSAHGNRASSLACCIPRGTGKSFAIHKKNKTKCGPSTASPAS